MNCLKALQCRSRQKVFRALVFLFLATWQMTSQSAPGDKQTLWEFWRDYAGDDKVRRLMNSQSVGIIGGGCTGTMISPHIFLSAAHCGGPGLE